MHVAPEHSNCISYRYSVQDTSDLMIACNSVSYILSSYAWCKA